MGANNKQKDDKQFYLGNKNLPRPTAEFEWTPEMIRELKKSKRNILHFAENYFYIVNLDQGKQCIKLYRCQKRVLRGLRDNRFVSLLASRQIGKALALDTKIPTPTGFTTMGELRDGDQVFGLDGNPCNVVKAHDVLENRDCFEIEFDNGEVITADSEHLWFTQSRTERQKGEDGSVKTTKDLYDTLYAGNKVQEPNHRIPTCITGVQYDRKALPINPYVLGLWLGDGACGSSVITVGERDVHDLTNILNTQQDQFDKIILHEYNKNVYSLRLTVNEGIQTKSLQTLLSENNLLQNKHIPKDYMFASRDQRISLLQGLLDSDGYINKKGLAQFYNTNIELVEQAKSLIESLGYKVTYKKFIPKLRGVECKEVGVLTFTPIEYVCRLSFKRARIRPREFSNNSKLRHQWHYIKHIKLVKSVPVRCITVDSPDNLFLVSDKYIASHNTTLMTIYCLWIACFQEDQRILIVANKEQTAINIFRRVRMAYEMLPNWLKPGVEEYGKTSMVLANGSSIGISTTSSDAGRGDSCNVLVLDELAFIDNHLVQDFWRSVFPIISSSKKSKIFVASTPNGTDNLFHQLYTNAEKGESNWHAERVDWWEIPGRDEEWKDDTIKALGSMDAFNQEFGNVFLQTGESIVDDELFDKLKQNCKEPLYVFDEGHYLLWDEPRQDRIYTIGVDIAEGVGENASVVQVLDITDLTNIEQVAVYQNNKISPYNFTTRLYEILQNWGSPPVAIERNNCGAQVVDNIRNQLGYSNLINFAPKNNSSTRYDNRAGVVAHTNTKYKGVVNMRYWVNELRAIKFNDVHTINELKTFVRYPNGTWAARKDGSCLDDRVMSLIWSLIVLEATVTENYYEIVEYDENQKPLKLKSIDYGIKEFVNPLSIYSNEKYVGENGNPAPTIFQSAVGEAPLDGELADLEGGGWKFHNPKDKQWVDTWDRDGNNMFTGGGW